MYDIELEDYFEEIKYNMTEYEELTEAFILEWEEKAMRWVKKNSYNADNLKKRRDEYVIMFENEDIAFQEALNVANKFYKAVKNNGIEEYWKTFRL